MKLFVRPNGRGEAMKRAVELFDDWVGHCTDGELLDLLQGNHGAYTNFPNISQYMSEEERGYWADEPMKDGPFKQ